MDLENAGGITLEKGGKEYTGCYIVEKDIITVIMGLKMKSVPLGSLPPEEHARLILMELINQGDG